MMSPISVGQIYLDQFRVDAFIASGGMGSVYRVWDLKRNVPLAMKVLHSDLADDPTVIKRFKREANALKKLAHPNIVPFYGLYQTPGFSFLLERYVDGPSLKEILRRKHGEPISTDEALIYLKALSAALGYAHANGIVHCDIKPGNVMVDKGGNIYLTDFGITRHAESSATTLATLGTAAYMAPEQIRGKPVTPATDVYALGVMLFEMLTGGRPYKGDEKGTEKAGTTAGERMRYGHLMLQPPNPRLLNPLLPESISSIILQALQKDPSQRFDNTQAFYIACCNALKLWPPDRVELGEHETAAPAKKTIRNKAGLLITGGVSLILIITASWVFVGSIWKQPAAVLDEQSVVTVVDQTISTFMINSTATSISFTTTPSPITPTHTPAPTKTANPSPTQTEDRTSYFPLQGCAPSRLHNGDWVYFSGTGQQAIRNSPDTHPSNNIVARLNQAEVVQIIGGPECNYGWVLWKIRRQLSKDVELEGWTPEGDGTNYWLEAITQNEVCMGGLPTRLHIGDQAYVNLYPATPNRVRDKPDSTYGSIIGRIQPGEQVIILDGPECNDGWVWWKIRSLQTGTEGWTAEGENPSYWLVPYKVKL
jgi:serine/threonine protein kinase